MNQAEFLRSHRCHDVPFLLKRWEAVAEAAGLELRTVFVTNGLPVIFVHSPDTDAPRFYASAEIHGDEPAGASGRA